jgi:hypothetical protein
MNRSIILLLTIFLAAPGLAREITLTPYQASYALYRGSLNVARSKLSLEQSGRYWRWRQTSKAKGIYSLLSNKILYAETTLLRLENRYRIHNILLTDDSDGDRFENARFDWNNQQIDVQYKNKRYVVTVPGDVYDSHSIHLLTAQMLKQNLQQSEFYFYRRGKLSKSRLKRTGKSTIEINNKPIEVLVFELTSKSSGSILKIYYDPNKPLLPIKIVRTKPGKKTTIMLLESVEWR